MLIQFRMCRDYSAYESHREKQSTSEVPYGMFHDQNNSYGVNSELYNALSEALQRWSATWTDATCPVLISFDEELEFNLSLMGVKSNYALVYDYESGTMCFGSTYEVASSKIRSHLSGRSSSASPSRGRGTRNAKLTPFFDFSLPDPEEGYEPFTYLIEDANTAHDISKVIRPFVEHHMKENFINVVEMVWNHIIEDNVYNYYDDWTLKSYPFKDWPLMQYYNSDSNRSRRDKLCFSDTDVELFMHVLNECNSMVMGIKKDKPKIFMHLEMFLRLLKFEIDHDLGDD